jgi:NADH:ubiquinone reductase (H+-translocating)
MKTSSPSKHRVVVAGAGFGGIRTALHLAKRPDIDVALISSNDTFAYYPQLYHAATGGVRAEAAIPLADLLAGSGVTLIQDTVTVLDPKVQTITTLSGAAHHYDELVLSLGSVTNYFGIPGLEEFSFNIKTIEGAEAFKHHLHEQLIRSHKPELHYVIVGGGPTGVELAGALGEYLRRITRQHGISAPKYQINLVEGALRLLPRSSERVAAKVQRRLERLGVTVHTGAVVEAETADSLRLKGESIASHTVVWTAGVGNNPFFRNNADHMTLAKNGKVEVNEYLEACPQVHVIGDNAATPYSGLAQTALADADFVACDIAAKLDGRRRPVYHPAMPVSVIPVGAGWAAVQWGRLELFGYVGWILRRLADLIGYHDLASWPHAVRTWLQDTRHEDGCPVCA